AEAHEPSTAHLSLDLAGGNATWTMSTRVLDALFRLDADGDGVVEPSEIQTRDGDIRAYAQRRLELRSSAGRCRPSSTPLDLQGDDAVLRFRMGCQGHPEWLELRYDAMFEVDSNHRAFLRLDTGRATHADIFSSRHRQARYPLEATPWWTPLTHFVVEGVWHILIGYDHILFLLTLILPAVLLRPARVGRRRVLRIVTSFTVAHSITLSLAVFGWVSIPSAIVESTIAASIVVAALENLRPVAGERTWLMTFGFGLIHGFGFASVLHEVGLPGGRLAVALFGFNVGVELGQLALVAMALPMLWLIGRHPVYPRLILPLGSGAIAVVGLHWLLDRALGISLVELAGNPIHWIGVGLLATAVLGLGKASRIFGMSGAWGALGCAGLGLALMFRPGAGLPGRPTVSSAHGRGEAPHLEALGELWLTKARPAEAIGAFRSALALFEEAQDLEGQARLHRRLGHLAELVGSTSEAIFHHRQALDLHEAEGASAEVRVDCLELARLYRRHEEFDAAASMMERALKLSRAAGDQGAVASTLVRLAHVRVLTQQTDEAERLYRSALERVQVLADREQAGDAWANLGALRRKAGKLEEAREYLRRGLAIYVELGREAKVRRVERLLADLTPSN
ncbi:MAG: HupE/UreJ family protein, partial [Myxococcota bacterium]